MTFGIGATVGEEWLFRKHEQSKEEPPRSETCFSRSNSCVLEVSWSDLLEFKEAMSDSTNKKDISLLD